MQEIKWWEDGEMEHKPKREELISDACWGNVIVLVDFRCYLNQSSRGKSWYKEKKAIDKEKSAKVAQGPRQK